MGHFTGRGANITVASIARRRFAIRRCGMSEDENRPVISKFGCGRTTPLFMPRVILDDADFDEEKRALSKWQEEIGLAMPRYISE